MMWHKRQKGFTLIEVMIVVAVIGILAAIAYPSYMDSVRKSNRSDAKAALSDAAQQMERCRSATGTFTDCSALGSSTSPEGLYTIEVATTNTGDTFTATATPVVGSVQAGDTDCPSFALNHLGSKTPDPGTDTHRCW